MTYYTFALPVEASQEDYPALVCRLLERLLLLGEVISDPEGTPTEAEIQVPNQKDRVKKRLFEHPDQHLWHSEHSGTTKQQLHTLRANGNVDATYDIDVLRMTEPRILYIHDTLRSINRLRPAVRMRVLAAASIDNDIHESCVGDELPVAFQAHISHVLSQAIPLANGVRLQPKAFRFRRFAERDTDLVSLIDIESTAEIFAHFLDAFRGIIRLTLDKDRISQFALCSYEHWLEPSSGEPFEILGTLSRDCNAKCDFCYVLGNPSNTAIKLQKFSSARSGEEARQRLAFFQKGLMLPLPTYDTEEITTHPLFFEICKGIRSASSKCISITTNGYRLTNDNVRKLKEFEPIDISLSLNAVTPETRQWLMGGSSFRGLEALSILERYEISCAVTVAAWPRVSVEEVISAIRFADGFNVRSISVLLGGYTKWFPNPPEYPIPEYWNHIIDAVRPLRTQISTPLIIQPRLYEEQYAKGNALGASIVIGINKHSPAAASDLKVYDEILGVNDIVISTRNQCLSVLSILRTKQGPVELTLRRNDRILRVVIDSEQAAPRYIYGRTLSDRFGIHLMGENIKISSIRQVYQLVNDLCARRVLFLTSMIVQPFLVQALQQFAILSEMADIEFDLQVVPNKFLGGNIVMGDMLVLDDFIAFLRQYLNDNPHPDLVLLPSGPFNHGGWLRDMKGQPVELLKRFVPVPIQIIKAPYFE